MFQFTHNFIEINVLKHASPYNLDQWVLGGNRNNNFLLQTLRHSNRIILFRKTR